MRRAIVALAAVACAVTALVPADAATREPKASVQGRFSSFHLLQSGWRDYDDRWDAGFVRDAYDTTHAVILDDSRIIYATRASGSSRWQRQAVRGSSGPDGTRSGELATSPNGRRVYLAANLCGAGHGLYVVSADARATSFRSLTTFPPVASGCDVFEEEDTNWGLRGIVGLPRGRVAVLVNKPSSDSIGDEGIYVFTGRPGGTWRRTLVTRSSAEDDQPLFLARDVDTGRLIIAGGTSDSDVQVFSKDPHKPWSAPKAFTVPLGTSVTGLTAMRGQAWLAYQHCSRYPYQYADGSADEVLPMDGVYLTHRSRSGTWSDPVRPFGADENSLWLRLLADSKHKRVFAVYANADPDHRTTTGGMYRAQLTVGHGWSAPAQLTHWWVDIPLHLAVTTTGRLRYEFQRD